MSTTDAATTATIEWPELRAHDPVVGFSDRLGLVGQTIDGRYVVTELIGEGGMGAVYRAEHARIGRQVAIKCLHHEFRKDPQTLERFLNEARAAGMLGHPNIAESTDMGELADGAPYLVLEYLDGHSVEAELAHGAFAIERALHIARQIAAGVEAAHARGIIHRDLKSENIFLVTRDGHPDHVKILDFGVSRMLDRASSLTKPGALVGTPEFMAPEQIADADNVDGRADVYAVGAILYHMLSGRKPFGGMPLPALLSKILHDSPRALWEVPKPVRNLVETAMARDRDTRIESMTRLREEIEVVVAMMTDDADFSGSTPIDPIESIATPRIDPTDQSDRAATEPVAPPIRSSPYAPNPLQPARARRPRRRIAIIGISAAITAATVYLVATHISSDEGDHAAAPPIAVTVTTPTPAPVAPPPVAPAPVAPAPVATPAPVVTPEQTSSPPPVITEHRAPAHDSAAKSNHPPQRPAQSATKSPPAKADPSASTPSPAATEPGHATEPPPDASPPVAPPPPVAKPKPPTIDSAAVRTVVRSHIPAVQQCFERAKMDDSSLKGNLTARITVAGDGSVAHVAITSTLHSASVETCINGEIVRWRFPAPSDGAPVTFSYPFVFD